MKTLWDFKEGHKQRNVLYKGIALASRSHRVLMKVDKFQLPEGFENLLNVALRKVEVE
jgi:hypothetical protein